MSVTPSSTVVGVFQSRSAADQAIEALYSAGFAREQMRYIAPNTSGGFFEDLKSFFTGTSTNTSDAEGDASNPLAALGLSRETAQYYSDEYNKGNPVLVVNAQEHEQEVLDILQHYGAYNAQVKAADDVQPLINASQQSTHETPTLQSNAQSWGSHLSSQTAQAAPFEDRQQDTEPFSAIKPSSTTATPSYDPTLYHAQADENIADNPGYSAAPFSDITPAFDVSQESVDSPAQEEETLATQESVDPSENKVGEEETLLSRENMDTPEREVDEVDEEEMPVPQANIDTFKLTVDEEEIPASQEAIDTPEREVEETDTEEVPVSQASVNTSENTDDEIATPALQTDMDASENTSDETETPALQTHMDGYQESPVVTDVSTHTADAQPLSERTATSEHTEELQQLQEQIKITQQQLQNAKAQLEATRERENQYRKRQKQLQNARKQLQDLQEELQATQIELQETATRLASYQYPGMENSLRKLEKPKKSKKQQF